MTSFCPRHGEYFKTRCNEIVDEMRANEVSRKNVLTPIENHDKKVISIKPWWKFWR